MNNSDAPEFRHLIAAASDGTLTQQQSEQLDAILLEDSINQYEYLDHMWVHALLDFIHAGQPEFNHPSPLKTDANRPKPQAAFQASPIVLISFTALACVIAVATWGFVSWSAGRLTHTYSSPLVIFNSGFEQHSELDSLVAPSAWYGDRAEIVGVRDGVSPYEGAQMLRFIESTNDPHQTCEVYQVVNIASELESLGADAASLQASVQFNSVKEKAAANRYIFGMTLFALVGDPFQQKTLEPFRWERDLHFNGAIAVADQDPDSWQELSLSMPLDKSARYIVLKLSVTSDEERLDLAETLPGQFIDNVMLTLTKPQTID